jgi:SNF family Na+-dependent transporter
MNNFKSIFQSKAMWTAFLGFVFALLAALGVLPAGFDTAQATGIVFAVLSAVFGLFRYNATEQLAPTKQAAARLSAARRY